MRCPGHTIQFPGCGYAEYIKEVLGVVGINVDSLEWKSYESWAPYLAASGEDQSWSSQKSGPGVSGDKQGCQREVSSRRRWPQVGSARERVVY